MTTQAERRAPPAAPGLAPPAGRWPSGLRALAHPNFRLYWSGQLVSLAGTWMQTAAQQWLVYRLTGSPLSLGTVMFANTLPNMLFMLFAGVVADRNDKRRIILVTQTTMMVLAFALAALTFSGVVQYWHVVVMAALLGTANAFDMPARQSFTVEMVGKEDLTNAIGLNASAFNIARLLGPAVSGLMVAAVGEAWSFAINGASFLAVLSGLLLMRFPERPRPAPAHSALLELSEGFRYLLNTPVIRLLVGTIVMPAIFGYNYIALLPIFAGDILRIGAGGFGLLMSSVGGGALVGALTLATVGGRLRRGRMVTIGALVFSMAQFGFALSRWQWLSMAFLVFTGWGMSTQLATTNTLIQSHVADRMRGRVMATYMWVLVGLAPPGALVVGAVAEAWGAPLTVAVCSALCGLVALLFIWRAPQIRRLE
jgi:MFS family permease